MKRVVFPVVSAFLFAAGALAQDGAATKASGLDYSDNANRDKSIVCKAGDHELHAGQSVGQLFGDAWPVQPDGVHLPAKILRYGRTQHPKGLESQHALVVTAVLVDPNGKPVAAHAICSSATGFGTAAERSALNGRFEPATVDGKAITSVAITIIAFKTSSMRSGGEGG